LVLSSGLSEPSLPLIAEAGPRITADISIATLRSGATACRGAGVRNSGGICGLPNDTALIVKRTCIEQPNPPIPT
jgi:hypothetical protein